LPVCTLSSTHPQYSLILHHSQSKQAAISFKMIQLVIAAFVDSTRLAAVAVSIAIAIEAASTIVIIDEVVVIDTPHRHLLLHPVHFHLHCHILAVVIEGFA
jgi:hypothetical protein